MDTMNLPDKCSKNNYGANNSMQVWASGGISRVRAATFLGACLGIFAGLLGVTFLTSSLASAAEATRDLPATTLRPGANQIMIAAAAAPRTTKAAATPVAAPPAPAEQPKGKGTTLLVMADGVIVYSGPNTRFRPLRLLNEKTELRASRNVIHTKRGDFYKVLTPLGDKHRAIGYIPTTAKVTLNIHEVDEEDIEKFGGIALINRAIQGSYSRYQNGEAEFSAGYLRYFAPGFYGKAFLGDFTTNNGDGGILGIELGNDALIVGPISAFVCYGAGIFYPVTQDTIFEGSKSLNLTVTASVGLRVNIMGRVSMSLAGTQIALFNANNSHVTYGATATLEIGL